MTDLYCLVVNGVVETGPCPLPADVDPIHCIQAGWYPFYWVTPLTYDRLVHYELSSFQVEADRVQQVRSLVPLTPEQATESRRQFKAYAVDRVNTQAGAARARFITVTAGQEATYLWKGEEAKAWQAAASPVDTDYPILKAEAEACQMLMADVVTLVLQKSSEWRLLAAEIEGVRRGALLQIEAALTEAEIDAVRPVFPAPVTEA